MLAQSMLSPAFLLSAFPLGWFSRLSASDTLTLSPKAQISTNTSSSIDSTFVGFAFEAASFHDYAGPGSPFSRNLVQNIADRTGAKPIVRVGGTSLDHSFYNRSLNTWAVIPGNGRGVVKNVTFGPSYFDVFRNWSNVTYTIDCPLAYKNLNQTLQFAEDAYRVVGHDNIAAFEVGNEPNLYVNVDRPSQYGPTQWVKEWTHYSTSIADALNLSTSQRHFQTLAISHNDPAWDVQNVFPDGLNNVTQRISSAAFHYYDLQRGNTQMQGQLMNHTFMRRKMAYVADAVSWMKQHHSQIPVMMNEVGAGEVANRTLEASFGAALWLSDYLLYNMAIDVARVNYQQGTGFSFSLWQPVQRNGRAPEVMPIYYGMLFAAEFLGRSGNVRVKEIGGHHDTLAAYAAYEGGNLARVAIVNLNLWEQGKARTSTNVTLHVPSDVQNVTVRRLTSTVGAAGLDPRNVTWAGLVYTKANNGLGRLVGSASESVNVQGQDASLVVNASEAVIVHVAS
ncbi:hypothetical protein EIP86_010412 [Pleurotus ostreatoroseus]|nr:hypothetical protein EIP86_010412 [Pleurotus ostreatoroseus]